MTAPCRSIAAEVARCIGRHGTKRVAKAALIGAVPPAMLKTGANYRGKPIEGFDQIRGAVRATMKVSEGMRESFRRQAMMAGYPPAIFSKAFTKLTSPGV
jgi:non-heme chloroperoxidase